MSVAGCVDSLIKELHHFRILGDDQVSVSSHVSPLFFSDVCFKELRQQIYESVFEPVLAPEELVLDVIVH